MEVREASLYEKSSLMVGRYNLGDKRNSYQTTRKGEILTAFKGGNICQMLSILFT